MAWSSDDLVEIEKAIASGVTTVTYNSGGGNKTVTYRSLEEMMKIRDMMRKDLGLIDRTNLRVYPKYSKGFD